MTIEQIAKICHEANRAYCAVIGDNTQSSWESAKDWQRESACVGVQYALDNPDAPDSAQHDAWSADKLRDGWTYGGVKDHVRKTHPCLVPFANLPAEQQVKDKLFRAVVRACA